jgi:hypothetical protein
MRGIFATDAARLHKRGRVVVTEERLDLVHAITDVQGRHCGGHA